MFFPKNINYTIGLGFYRNGVYNGAHFIQTEMALSQLSSFIAANTTLIAVAAFLLVALIYMEFRAVRFGVKKLTAQDAVAVMNEVGTLTVDIRSEEKFKQGT